MANSSHNRINAQITQENMAEIKLLVEAIGSKIPEAGMTPQEYKRFRGIDVNNKVFTEDCIQMLRLNGDKIMPPYIDYNAIVTDYELFESLDNIHSMLKGLIGRVRTAQRIAGKESLVAARSAYQQYGLAAKAGVEGAQTAYDLLSKHFDAQKSRKKDILIKNNNKTI